MKKVLNILIGLTLVGFGTAASAQHVCWHNEVTGTTCCLDLLGHTYCAGHIVNPENPVPPVPAD